MMKLNIIIINYYIYIYIFSVVIEDGFYYIKNPFTNKYLQVKDKSAVNNAIGNVGDFENGSNHQRWNLINLSDGYFTIQTKLGGDESKMSMANGKNDENEWTQLHSNSDNSNNSIYKLKSAGNNVYYIITKQSEVTGIDQGLTIVEEDFIYQYLDLDNNNISTDLLKDYVVQQKIENNESNNNNKWILIKG